MTKDEAIRILTEVKMGKNYSLYVINLALIATGDLI
jgi:hypothetical protein